MVRFLNRFLPKAVEIKGRYVEPFVGGGAIFLYLQPSRAILSDVNVELVDLYKGIRGDPIGVWETYAAFGNTKDEYKRVRSLNPLQLNLTQRAARLLYLNRTCFKGNWRHNANGEFNVGYGGQARRWVVNEHCLKAVAGALAPADLQCSDFEPIIDRCEKGDYLFVDPPYRPGERDPINSHYGWKQFAFEDHERLAVALTRCAKRGALWCMTTSAHPDILSLFRGFLTLEIPPRKRGITNSGEVLILVGGGG